MKIGDWTIGSEGVEVPFFVIREGATRILPPAKQIWSFTLRKVNYLMDVYSLDSLPKESEGLIRSTLVTQSIAMLVNGMEVYTKSRFVEMENNGKQADKDALLRAFVSNKERRIQIEHELSNNKTIVQILLDHDLIKFHNWKHLRCAFLAAYMIDVNTLTYQNANLVDRMQVYIRWRHRITHAAEEPTLLNPEEFHKGAKPVFANKETLDTVKDHIQDLVETMDKATA